MAKNTGFNPVSLPKKVSSKLDNECPNSLARIDKQGVSAVEYGILAALMATIVIAVVTTLGGGIQITFGSIATHLINGN